MKAVTLLIVLASNEGYWLSGDESQMRLQWAVDALATPSDLNWELKLGEVQIATGRAAMGPDQSLIVRLPCPEVRTRVSLQWNWRLVRKQDGRELASGTAKISAYPRNITDGWAELVAGRRIVVVDRAAGIPALLARAKIKHVRLDDPSELQRLDADIVMVGADMLRERLFEQAPLQGLFRSGKSVVVFQQSTTSQVLGYSLVTRAAPERFTWPVDDPLLRGLDADDLRSWEQSWNRGDPQILPALRVPASEASSALIQWPAGAQGGAPPAAFHTGDRDALMVSRSGRARGGRLLLCQLPLGNWLTDPRSQIFFGNVLDVLVSPPSPVSTDLSPAQGARRLEAITISPGDAR